jgi:hypothetical protein
MKRKKTSICLLICFAFFLSNINSQTNNLTGSPYSLFGLGVESKSNIGKYSGLGYTGLASDATYNINILNPALFATIPKQKFMFDFGVYAEVNNISNGKEDEYRGAWNFSNISLAFNANGKYGIGLSLIPSTNVGYALIGVETEIEGSTDKYISNITGSGGLNSLKLDYGRKFLKNLNVGISLSYLFGSIDEIEKILLQRSLLSLRKENYYNGVMLGLGAQFKLNKYNFGLVIDSPSILKGSKDTSITKISDSDDLIVDNEKDVAIDDFVMPLKLKLGFNTKIYNIELNLDYKRSFWTMTNQSDFLMEYVDQDILGIGFDYSVDNESYSYWKRINIRAGFSYDSGYLEYKNTKIRSYNLTFGLGVPLGNSNNSFINISYSNGNSGSTNGILVDQNYNTINLNLSLSDIWFIKKKFN